jgi:hypothetical protein
MHAVQMKEVTKQGWQKAQAWSGNVCSECKQCGRQMTRSTCRDNTAVQELFKSCDYAKVLTPVPRLPHLVGQTILLALQLQLLLAQLFYHAVGSVHQGPVECHTTLQVNKHKCSHAAHTQEYNAAQQYNMEGYSMCMLKHFRSLQILQ